MEFLVASRMARTSKLLRTRTVRYSTHSGSKLLTTASSGNQKVFTLKIRTLMRLTSSSSNLQPYRLSGLLNPLRTMSYFIHID